LEDEPETIQSPSDPKPASFENELVFDDVHFRYEKGPPVLQGLSFRVRKGERVAFVGHTGAGKSTILRLFDRAYDIQSGGISLDGVDIRDMDVTALRGLSTAVPQDVFLFSGTLRDNLVFANPAIGDDALMRAVEACQAEGVLSRHGGLDGEVRERGQNFSMGERQLLALVRALVTDPPILILDEATASVDRETERRLQTATEILMQGRTSLIVAHRLSTIRQCDRIIVMSRGQIVESGSHDELMAKQGQYAALVELQQREESL
jgi:ATP-binding cassette subfamily B protein